MRAIDLYAGVGGWSVGLKLAGIDVVQAYEIWPAAVNSYNQNLLTNHKPTNVRTLELKSLPKDIDLVVGSPPCTQFSYSNRGGNGDLEEGLKDIIRFLEIVNYIKPKFWVMENVPRTASIIEDGLSTIGHPLYKYRKLKPYIKTIDFSEYGLPQSRKRCLVGNFPIQHFESYKRRRSCLTLGEVIGNLNQRSADIIDPVWGFPIPRTNVSENLHEQALVGEHLRMNKDAKNFHPIYNDMSFPDSLHHPSRTITATCTRVSRESIVIEDEKVDGYRRLSIRERASLQSFPITYQFYGTTCSQKIKMVGNAIPPLVSWMIGLAVSNTPSSKLCEIPDIANLLPLPSTLPTHTPPHSIRTKHSPSRRFRAAITGLRFKSGMRFELANAVQSSGVEWNIGFYFGSSKAIRSLVLDRDFLRELGRYKLVRKTLNEKQELFSPIRSFLEKTKKQNLQSNWSNGVDKSGPYELIDLIGEAAAKLCVYFKTESSQNVLKCVKSICPNEEQSNSKFDRFAPEILSGLILGSWFNCQP